MPEIDIVFKSLEYVSTFVGAISGIRLASMKRFDFFGAFVVGCITGLGGGTLRDVMLGIEPFWLADMGYVLATALALVAVFVFGRRFMNGQVTWFIFDTISISLFMIIGLEKTLLCGKSQWVAVIMGVITAVFGGVLRDICINEVPLVFRAELYALACAAGGVVFLGLEWVGVDAYWIRYSAGVLTIFVLRALAIKYKIGVPILNGRQHFHHHHKPTKKHE